MNPETNNIHALIVWLLLFYSGIVLAIVITLIGFFPTYGSPWSMDEGWDSLNTWITNEALLILGT